MRRSPVGTFHGGVPVHVGRILARHSDAFEKWHPTKGSHPKMEKPPKCAAHPKGTFFGGCVSVHVGRILARHPTHSKMAPHKKSAPKDDDAPKCATHP